MRASNLDPRAIPLALYIHLPWCVRKCPYCDFNSHAAGAEIPEQAYVDALLRDLSLDAALIDNREVVSVFLGGGTPSLFSPEAIARLLAGVRAQVRLASDAEITLEANPGTVDNARFRGFRDAGVNRLSIGIQSFDDAKLKALGRIHGRDAALAAGEAARAAGFDNFNLDLMYGLPEQTVDQALADVETAIALKPTHLSVYQLTLEPNTEFYVRPPVLPNDEQMSAMHDALMPRLHAAGYAHYEVSAYAQGGHECRHNRNYWEFGDYLGIGAGAHAKISRANEVMRFSKTRQPQAYLRQAGGLESRINPRHLSDADLIFEFFLNTMRLNNGVDSELFAQRTGLALNAIAEPLQRLREQGFMERDRTRLRPSARGRQFLNDLLLQFLPPST